MGRRAHFLPADDPALDAAYRAARETFGYFWRELSWEHRRIVSALSTAAVKAAFAEDGPAGRVVEHLWVVDVDFDGETVRGVVLNDPFELEEVHAGDPVEIGLGEVEDWMLVIDGVLHGGHTIHAIRAALGRRERRRHDRAWGLTFPDEVLLVHGQQAHPERLVDHPMCLAARPEVAAVLQTQRHLATDLDQEGLTMLHREALAGNAPIVELLLAFGADRDARTPAGRTASELAARLGWTRVVEVLDA